MPNLDLNNLLGAFLIVAPINLLEQKIINIIYILLKSKSDIKSAMNRHLSIYFTSTESISLKKTYLLFRLFPFDFNDTIDDGKREQEHLVEEPVNHYITFFLTVPP